VQLTRLKGGTIFIVEPSKGRYILAKAEEIKFMEEIPKGILDKQPNINMGEWLMGEYPQIEQAYTNGHGKFVRAANRIFLNRVHQTGCPDCEPIPEKGVLVPEGVHIPEEEIGKR